MKRFNQIHLLTSYPPSNPNRDDLGRPKTARMGGVDRLRISSQSLKRAWRTSDVFEEALKEHIGSRTRRLGRGPYRRFVAAGIKEKDAATWAKAIAEVFGKLKSEKGKKVDEEETNEEQAERRLSQFDIEQLAHISREENAAVDALVELLITENRAPSKDDLDLLRHPASTADVALFGRMLAANPLFNVEAACQVAHAISVHPVVIEDDYFTAVDDLNAGDVDRGAGHVGEAGYAAALFYMYFCIDRELLRRNLGGDDELAAKAVRALVEAATTVAPGGKQNSFASRVRASFALAEAGDQQPRSLSVAFLNPVIRGDYGVAAVTALTDTRDKMDAVYGSCADKQCSFNSFDGTGSLEELLRFLEE